MATAKPEQAAEKPKEELPSQNPSGFAEWMQIKKQMIDGAYDDAAKSAMMFGFTGSVPDEPLRKLLDELAEHFIKKGQDFFTQQAFPKAKEMFEKAIDCHPDDWRGYFHKSMCLKKLGNMTSAMEVHQRGHQEQGRRR